MALLLEPWASPACLCPLSSSQAGELQIYTQRRIFAGSDDGRLRMRHGECSGGESGCTVAEMFTFCGSVSCASEALCTGCGACCFPPAAKSLWTTQGPWCEAQPGEAPGLRIPALGTSSADFLWSLGPQDWEQGMRLAPASRFTLSSIL